MSIRNEIGSSSLGISMAASLTPCTLLRTSSLTGKPLSGWIAISIRPGRGPCTCQEAIARIVLTSLRRGVELGHYELRAWAIMGQSCARTSPAKGPAVAIATVAKGHDRTRGQQVSGSNGGEVLAGGVVRSLGKRRK